MKGGVALARPGGLRCGRQDRLHNADSAENEEYTCSRCVLPLEAGAPLEVLSAERNGICRARRRVKRPGPAYGLVLLGDPALPAGSPDPATSCGMALRRVFPCRRMRRPRRASRHLSRQPFGTPASCVAPNRDTTSDRSAVAARPRATACCHLHARLIRQARAVSRAPQRNGRRGYAPIHARPRRGVPCPCGASTALPRDCGEARPAPSGAATDARRFVRRRPKGASDCGRLYHAVITAALTACLADPLPLLRSRPI